MISRWLSGMVATLMFLVWQVPVQAEEPGALRVMSFNIRYGTADDGANHWDKRRDFLVERVKAFNPDLLGTQETLDFQKNHLALKLDTHEAWGVGRDDGVSKGEMSALFYRRNRFDRIDSGHFWLSETPDRAGSRSWDSSLPRMVSWVKLRDKALPGSKPVLFLNTHFDHRGQKARLESARLIKKQIETLGKDAAVILTGDFNEGEGSPPYGVFFGLFGSTGNHPLALQDTFRVAFPKRVSGEGTFNDFQPQKTNGERIDWIGCSNDWTVSSASIDRTTREGRVPSDHFPVMAVLEPTKTAIEVKPQPKAKPPIMIGGSFSVKEIRDIAYCEGPDADPLKQKLDLFIPDGQKDFPVIFFIHGGSWTQGDRKLYGAMGRVFAKNGVGAVVISYRLSPKVQHPAHIQDVARAFAWTCANIGSYGGKADRIFVCGHSAGGHLGSLLATNPAYLKEVNLSLKNIRGVMPLSGVFTFAPGSFEKVLGSDKATAKAASPIQHVCVDCPPFEILYAEKDYKTLDRMAIDFHAALGRCGVPSRCSRIDDRNHISIMVNLMTNEEDPATQTLLEFISRHSELKLCPKGK